MEKGHRHAMPFLRCNKLGNFWNHKRDRLRGSNEVRQRGRLHLEMEAKKTPKDSLVVKSALVLPTHTNNHHTLFGGTLMSYIDDVSAQSAAMHARNKMVVTASTDSVDFLEPIREGNSVCLQSFVISTGRTSMEVFVKIMSEDLETGERTLCATSFLTMVSIDADGKPKPVSKLEPVTEEEIHLFQTAGLRKEMRKLRREQSKELAMKLSKRKPWQ
jgi:acyl-CoA hydrolase